MGCEARSSWLENALYTSTFRQAILICKLGQTDLVLMRYHGSLGGLWLSHWLTQRQIDRQHDQLI